MLTSSPESENINAKTPIPPKFSCPSDGLRKEKNGELLR
jgi:hypothetical protein